MNNSKKDVNVLIVSNYPNSTGYAWKNIYRLFEKIAEQVRNENKGKVIISFPFVDDKGNLIALKKFDEVITCNVWPNTFVSLIRLLKIIKAKKIRYMYLTDQCPTHPIYALFRFAGVQKILVHYRVSVSSPFPDTEKRKGVFLLKKIYRRLPFINAHKIYAVSDFVKNRLIKKYGVRKNSVVTVLNGINVTRFDRPYNNPFPPDDPNIKLFACGRLTPEKGFQVLVNALSIVNAASQNKCTLYIAGDGPYKADLKNIISQLGLENNIVLLGEILDVTPYQLFTDINVVPSIWGDACPSSISESLCSNRPLICTEAGGIPEMVKSRDGNIVAIIVPPSDSQSIANSILQIILSKDKYNALAIEARNHVLDMLTEGAYYNRFFQNFLHDINLK